jgi:hypothetical protein
MDTPGGGGGQQEAPIADPSPALPMTAAAAAEPSPDPPARPDADHRCTFSTIVLEDFMMHTKRLRMGRAASVWRTRVNMERDALARGEIARCPYSSHAQGALQRHVEGARGDLAKAIDRGNKRKFKDLTHKVRKRGPQRPDGWGCVCGTGASAQYDGPCGPGCRYQPSQRFMGNVASSGISAPPAPEIYGTPFLPVPYAVHATATHVLIRFPVLPTEDGGAVFELTDPGVAILRGRWQFSQDVQRVDPMLSAS